MKGVFCLRAMWCRPAKTAVDDDAIIVPKYGISSPAVATFWPGRHTPVPYSSQDVGSDWQNGEKLVVLPSHTDLEAAAPATEHELQEPGHLGIDPNLSLEAIGRVSPEKRVREAEYEGEDDEDMVDRNLPQKVLDCVSDHPMSSGASDFTVAEYVAQAESVVDVDSAMYYQRSGSETCGSNQEHRNSFTDLEMVGGHISDPGEYLANKLDSRCSSPILPIDGESPLNGKAGKAFLKQVSFNAPSAGSDLQIVTLSFPRSEGSSSAGGEGRYFVNGGSVPPGGSPRSEDAYRCNANNGIFKLGTSSLAMERQHRKPWWKVFLVSQRNIHLESNGGKLGSVSEGDSGGKSPINGYMSDVEYRSAPALPSCLEDVSGSEKEQTERRLVEGRSQDSSGTSQQEFIDNSGTGEAVNSQPKNEISEGPVHKGELSGGDLGTAQKWDTFAGKTGLSRVEEWISSVQAMPPSTDDDLIQMEVEESPDSPTALAASFFAPDKESAKDRKQVAGAALDHDAEMAKLVVRSINPLSTVAHFSGVGLKVIPSLGMFGSLKTLNLSANSIVRITPGCLPKCLHSLDISRNQIVMVEGLRELTRLRVLNLSFNRITRIGNGLSSCTSLKEVYLVGNKISEVEGLHRLSKLVVLDLSFNKLTSTKSMGQVAANYKSLQALNLLGNAVHSNLGDEQMRRFVTGLCPQLVYLNKQQLKSVSNREALGKELKGSAKSVSKPSKRGNGHQVKSSSHRRTSSGGVTANGKSKSSVKGVVMPAATTSDEGFRKSHHSSHRVI